MANRKIIVLISLLISTLGIAVTLTLTTLQPPSELMPTLARIDQFVVQTEQVLSVSDVLSNLPIGDEMMIQWVGDSTSDELDSVLTNLGAEVVQEIPDVNAAVIVKTQSITPQQIADLPANVIVEPNYKVQSLLTYPSNDPMINDQWSFATMDVTTLWESVEANNTIVAVIDSGVCFNHPDLQGRFVDGGYDYIDDDTTPMDEMGHGCAVSGIIAANANNGIGIAGIAPNTKILPLRVLDADGVGTYADVISAIYQAVSSGADIINLSLGGQNHSQLLEQAVHYAVANGVQVVAGTGNTGTEGVFYPAKYPNVLAVGSYGIDGKRSSFSTYGNEVDTLAPGENILTTTKNGNYAYFTGTSVAVPYVTGLLALSNASGQPVDLANILDTPAPEDDGEVYALATDTRPAPTATPSVDVCASYTEDYVVGTVNSNLVEDFQMAVRCANASSADNVIDFNHQEVIIEEFDWGYSGFAAVKPIEPKSSAGKLTIENGVIKRASYLTCPAEGTSTGTVYFRFFTVKVGGDLTLNNMMLSNGCSTDANQNPSIRTEEDGGAIYNYGKLTINNSTLYNNRAYHYGGAIYNDGLLDINNSTIYNNLSEDEGGAIYSTSAGQVTINQTTISDNSSTTSIGGIYTQSGGTFTLSNSIVANSLSTDCDGVITFAGVNLVEDGSCDAATNGQLTGDPMLDPTGLQDNGGLTQTIALMAGSPAIDAGDNSQIPVEVTTDQRGIGYPRIEGLSVDLGAYETASDIICELYNPALLTGYIVGTVNSDLEADLRYAIECANQSVSDDVIDLGSLVVIVDDAPEDFDERGYNGLPPIFDQATSGSLMLQNGTITRESSLTCDNDVNDRTEFRLLMLMPNSDLTLTNVTVSNGCGSNADTSTLYANDGAGIHSQGATLTIYNSVIRDNTTIGVSNYGAGIYSDGGSLNITGSHFIANASDDNGTGIAVQIRDTVATIGNSSFSDNIGTTQSHNAVAITSGSTLEISNSIFNNNQSGAVSTHDSTLLVENSTFSQNQYQVVANNDSSLTINDSIFSNNTGLNGGSIFNWGEAANAEINNSTLNDNSYTRGAAIYNTVYADMVIRNSTITGNHAEVNGGGIYNANLATLTVINSTISDNSSGEEGGGIYNRTDLTLSNTIVANSTSGNDCENVSPGNVVYSGMNLVEDGSCDGVTSGQLTGNPMLDPTGLQDNGGLTQTIALMAGSSAIDAGDNSQIPVEVTTDQRGAGYPRIQGSTVDLGAYETLSPIICELYNLALPSGYTVGSVTADLVTDLTQAVECAAVTSGQDIIHLDSDEITLGHILTLTSGTTLNISSTVNISGTLNTSDNSTLNLLGSGIINNTGVMSNAGTFNIDGSMNNISGTFSNFHVIINNKSFLNTQNALFTNTSYGTVTNTLDSSFINSYGATSNNEGVFVINEDALLYNKGNSYFNNDGIIQNYDHGYEDGIFNSGTFNNRDGATIENVGTIFNLREIGIYSGTFNNQSGGVIDSSGWIHNLNYSIFNNDGTIINSDQFYNHSNGVINNHSLISNYGTFHNYINSAVNQDGTVDNFATVINAGTFVNTNVINHAGDTIRNVALLNNSGTINSNGLLDNQGTLNNTGAIITDVDNGVSSVGQITNTDTLNNATDATITIRTDTIFNNLTDGTVSNEGLIDNQGQFTNDELIYNCGIIINIHLITGTGIIDDPCLPSTPSDFAVITDPDYPDLPTFSGLAEPLTIIVLTSDLDGLLVLDNADVSVDGAWSTSLSVPLSIGTHQITAFSKDFAGNESVATSPLTVTVSVCPFYDSSLSSGYVLGSVNPDLEADLRQAIECANANTTDDMIDLSGLTVLLHYAPIEYDLDGFNGLPIITSATTSGTLTIQNGTIERDISLGVCLLNSYERTRFRLLYVSTDANLSLNDVTLRNGCAVGTVGSDLDGYGGAIMKMYGILSLENVTAINNKASYFGGAISVFGDADTIINNSTFMDNLSGNGGAVRTVGNTLMISGSTFMDNSAASDGGAVNGSLGSEVTINDSTFARNTATGSGGGIYIYQSNATINNSTITDNEAGYFGGGGVYVTGSSLTINNSTLSANPATSIADSLYLHSSATYVTNTIIANDVLPSCLQSNGSLRFTGMNLVEDGSCNAAAVGELTGDPMLDPAGLQNNGGATRTIALLEGSPAIDAGDNSQIPVGVTTDQRGTGYPRIQGTNVDLGAYETASDIICESYNTALLTGYSVGTVNSDLQADLRQAIECANTLPSNDVIDLNGATITFIDAPGTYDKMGHNALQPITSTSVAGTLTIQNGTISRDESLICDATTDSTDEFRFFYIEEDADVTLTNLTLDNGCASESPQNPPGYEEIKMFGGAIYNNGQLQINGSTLSNNVAQSDYEANEWGLGGAIYNVSGTTTVSNSILNDNIADIGAGIFSGLVASGDITVTNTTVSRNLATYGGGIMIIWGNLYVTDSTFDANQASTSNGGAISTSGSELVVSNSVFHDNHAGQNGGAIDAYPNILTINSSLFYNNSSNYAGGAIVSAPGISGTIVNTTVTYNTANLEGGGISVANDNHVINSTIAQNSAPRGTEIHGYFKPLVLTNSIIANSSGTSQCGSLLGEVSYEGLNLIQDGSCDAEANGQLVGDPLLGPLQNNGGQSQTMALLAGSPAINAGDNSLIPVDVDFDQRGAGYARVQGPFVDLGAFESDTPAGIGGTIIIPPTIAVTDDLLITVEDADISGDGTLIVTVEANADIETITLNETGADTGVFTGTVSTAYGLSNDEDNTNQSLNIQVGDVITVTYIDQLDENGRISQVIAATDVVSPMLTCDDYPTTYTVGTLNGDLAIDLRQAVECANDSVDANIIDLGNATIIYSDAPVAYDADTYNALEPIPDVASGGKLTIQNGIIKRADSVALCPGTSRDNYRFLHVAPDGDLTLNNVDLINGCVRDYGGAIYSQGTLVINDSSLSQNTALRGGAIYTFSGQFALNTVNLVHNGAGEQGGAIWSFYSDGSIDNSIIDNNALLDLPLMGSQNGGGIFFGGADDGVTLTITNSTISNNEALDHFGGGIYIYHANLLVDNSLIDSNGSPTEGREGGGIYFYGPTLSLTNSTISNNHSIAGAGLYLFHTYVGSLTFENNIFDSNISRGGAAAIYIYWADPETVFNNQTFINNVAQNKGAAVYTRSYTVFNNSLFANNTTNGDGGALYADNYITLNNTTIAHNTANNGGGIIAGAGPSTATINNSTIANNTALSSIDTSAGIYVQDYGRIELVNSVVANNNGAPDCLSKEYAHIPDAGVFYSGMNLIGDGSCGASSQGQLSGDPLLGTLQDNGGSTETMALLAGSPAINAGNNAFASGLIYDQRGVGYPRIYGARVDLGAYEYQPTGPTPTPSPTPTFTPTATYTPTIAPLLPISSISATFINETTSQMTWSDDNVDESGYRILRLVSDTWSEIDVVAPNVTTYLDAIIDCHADLTYDYQIQVYRDFDGNTAYSDMVSIWTGDCPFYPASELVANAIADEQVDLTWSDNSGLESNYVVERKTASQNWMQIANLSANSTAFSNNGLECERQYQYRVRGYQALFDRYTDPVTTIVTTGQCTVEAPFVTSTIMTSSQISIEWNPILPQQTTHIMVERAEHETEAIVSLDWQVNATVGGGATIFTDHYIRCGMTYSYRLQGYNDRHDEYTGYTDTIHFETDECPTAVSNTIGLYHNGRWVFRQGFENDSSETAFRFGPQEEGWIALTGDWDGDGIDGIGIYKDGVFALRDISDAGAVDYVYRFGSTQFDWQPIAGDWNGDGIDTVGLYHDGRFILTDSNTHPTMDYQFTFGKIESGWQPIAGDWFSHGRDYVGVYKDGVFLLHDNFGNRSSGTIVRFGSGDGWIPIAGDWDADGFTTIGLYKDSNWRLSNTNQRTVDIGFRFNYFNGQGFPLASYRGDDEALEALALFAVSAGFNVNAVSQPQEATPTLEPTDVSMTISATEVEFSPTMMPVSDTEDVMITITTTVESTLESTPEPSLTPTMTMIPTLTATWTPTATAVPTVEPTVTEQAVKQEPKPEATDEVSGG